MPLFYQSNTGYVPSGSSYISASTIDFNNTVPTIVLTASSFPTPATYVLLRANNYVNVPPGFPSSLLGGLSHTGSLTVTSVNQASTDVLVTLT